MTLGTMYLVAPLVVDGSHVDGADGAHAEHEEEGQADVDDGGELRGVDGFHNFTNHDLA